MVNLLSLLSAAAAVALPFASALPVHSAPSGKVSIQAGSIVADNYIVLLKSDVTSQQFEEHQAWATGLHNRRLTRRSDASLTGIKSKYHFGSFTAYSGAFDSSTIEQVCFNLLPPATSKLC
jgi:oryzin